MPDEEVPTEKRRRRSKGCWQKNKKIKMKDLQDAISKLEEQKQELQEVYFKQNKKMNDMEEKVVDMMKIMSDTKLKCDSMYQQLQAATTNVQKLEKKIKEYENKEQIEGTLVTGARLTKQRKVDKQRLTNDDKHLENQSADERRDFKIRKSGEDEQKLFIAPKPDRLSRKSADDSTTDLPKHYTQSKAANIDQQQSVQEKQMKLTDTKPMRGIGQNAEKRGADKTIEEKFVEKMKFDETVNNIESNLKGLQNLLTDFDQKLVNWKNHLENKIQIATETRGQSCAEREQFDELVKKMKNIERDPEEFKNLSTAFEQKLFDYKTLLENKIQNATETTRLSYIERKQFDEIVNRLHKIETDSQKFSNETQHFSDNLNLKPDKSNQQLLEEEPITDDIVQRDSFIEKSLAEIDVIHKDTKKIEEQILAFQGTDEDKTYLHLNELLIRNMVKLDNIESDGLDIIRKQRKSVLQFTQKCQDKLKNAVKRTT